MSQWLLFFALHLALVTWLRTRVALRKHLEGLRYWCAEVGYGLLIACPLLLSQL